MLSECFQTAAGDMVLRALREEQVEAMRLIDAVNNSLNSDSNLLSPEEVHVITQALSTLKESASHSQEIDVLRKDITTLAQVTEEFAARRMNANIRRALTGKNVKDID
jgi:molecular chaperone HscA